MKRLVLKCLTILLVFLTSHAAGFVDATLPEGLEFNVSVLGNDESCEGENPSNDLTLVLEQRCGRPCASMCQGRLQRANTSILKPSYSQAKQLMLSLNTNTYK